MLKETQLESVVPDGAMYVFCRLPDGLDGTVLAQKLLEHGVAVAPGEAFGQYRDYIRISACADIGHFFYRYFSSAIVAYAELSWTCDFENDCAMMDLSYLYDATLLYGI